MNWLNICALTDIPQLGARVIEGPKGDIALFRTSSDDVFALDDRCPHKHGPLSQGIVFGKTVACPLHNWQIALDSGEALAPDVGGAHRYPVRVEDGRVYLALEKTRRSAHIIASTTTA